MYKHLFYQCLVFLNKSRDGNSELSKKIEFLHAYNTGKGEVGVENTLRTIQDCRISFTCCYCCKWYIHIHIAVILTV